MIHKPSMYCWEYRQVLDCGDGVREVAALALEQSRGRRIAALRDADAKAVTSLCSSPHSKTLARGSPLPSVHGLTDARAAWRRR